MTRIEIYELARQRARNHVAECKHCGYYMDHNEFELRFREAFYELVVEQCARWIEDNCADGFFEADRMRNHLLREDQ
jgi:hypothetical protein